MAPVNKCAACHKKIPSNEEILTCYDCKHVYDLDCVKVSHERFSSMEPLQKESWKCPECCCKQPKSGNTNTPVRSAAAGLSDDDGRSNVTQRVKKGDESVLAREMKLFRSEVTALRLEVSQLREEFNTGFGRLSQAVEGVGGRMDDLELRIKALEDRPVSTGPADDVRDVVATIDRLQLELNDRDQELMLMDVEISGLPEVSGESTMHLASVVSQKLGVALETRDVVYAERVGRPQGVVEGGGAPRPRALVVRLARRALRDELLSAARRARGADTTGFGLPGPSRRFYVNERLTRTNRLLFYNARQAGARLRWKYVWTRDGRIYARRVPNSAAHRIRTEADLMKTFGRPSAGDPDPTSLAGPRFSSAADRAPGPSPILVADATTSDVGSQD